MKPNKLGALVLGALFALGMAGSASATTVVAGWDFSQYSIPGVLSTDGGNSPANTLAANYSNEDPTGNGGAESAAFGTMYIDGSFGSTNIVVDGSGTEPIVPIAGSLTGNLDAPVQGPGTNPFDTLSLLTSEGQATADLRRMATNSAVSVVFQADLSGIGAQATDWMLSLGAQTVGSLTNALIDVEYSLDGVMYTTAGNLAVDTVDVAKTLGLFTGAASEIFVKLVFANAGVSIDNLAIEANVASVPEPGTLALMLAGLVGLVAVARSHGSH